MEHNCHLSKTALTHGRHAAFSETSMLQIFCFALRATPLAGGLFVARDVEVLERLVAGSDKPLSSLTTHAEIATLAVAAGAPKNEAFPTLTELLQKFASLLKDAGKLQPDMPLARMTRDVAQSQVHFACCCFRASLRLKASWSRAC